MCISVAAPYHVDHRFGEAAIVNLFSVGPEIFSFPDRLLTQGITLSVPGSVSPKKKGERQKKRVIC